MKRTRATYRPDQTKKKKKKRDKERRKEQPIGQAHVQLEMNISFIYLLNSPHSVFSLFWRENILVDLRRKHLGPTNFVPFRPSNQTPTKKVFLHIFFSKFFIHPILPQNKHTLKDWEIFFLYYYYYYYYLVEFLLVLDLWWCFGWMFLLVKCVCINLLI